MSRSLDVVYFKEKLSLVIKDLDSYAINPADLARQLVRYARVADEQAAIDECRYSEKAIGARVGISTDDDPDYCAHSYEQNGFCPECGNTKTIDSVEMMEMNLNTNKLKSFDLDAALKGEPVMLRNGMKAFVRYYETELSVGDDSRLLGVAVRDNAEAVALQWAQQGCFLSSKVDDNLDIIGMYPKTRIINGFEVHAPETVAPANGFVIYIPSPIDEILYKEDRWASYSIDKIRLERGLVFLYEEDAIANAKAMLGIDPYEEAEESYE